MSNAIAQVNHILGALPAEEFATVLPDLRFIRLTQGQSIHEPFAPIERVYFPIDSALSLITIMENGTAVESGVVGREGFSAPQLVFGARVPASAMICQVPGQSMVMSADAFRAHLEALPEFKKLILAYMEMLFNFMGQSIACNRLHPLTQRLARWLLATQDRVDRNEFSLTQEFLSIMLGVARSAVTTAASSLQQKGLISYNRGVITILDRARFEDAACECYAVVTDGLNLRISEKVS